MAKRWSSPTTQETQPGTHMRAEVPAVDDRLLELASRNPALLYEVSPRKFEEFVARLMERDGYSVELTPATGDGGKDIYVRTRNEFGSFLYLVECKRYAPDHSVGVEIVRSLYGTLQIERATAGILVTTSAFTKG